MFSRWRRYRAHRALRRRARDLVLFDALDTNGWGRPVYHRAGYGQKARRLPFSDTLTSLAMELDDDEWNDFLCTLTSRLLRGLRTAKSTAAASAAVVAAVEELLKQGRGQDALLMVIRDGSQYRNLSDTDALFLRGWADTWASTDHPRLEPLVAAFGGKAQQSDSVRTRCHLKAGRSTYSPADPGKFDELERLFTFIDDRDRDVAANAWRELESAKPGDLLGAVAVSRVPVPARLSAMAFARYEALDAPAPSLQCVRALIEASTSADADLARRATRLLAAHEAGRVWTLLASAFRASEDRDVPLDQLDPSFQMTIAFAIPRLDGAPHSAADTSTLVDSLKRAQAKSLRWFKDVARALPVSCRDEVCAHASADFRLVAAIGGDAARSAYIRRRVETRWRGSAQWAHMRDLLSALNVTAVDDARAALENCVSGNEKHHREGVSSTPETADQTILSELVGAWTKLPNDSSEEDRDHACLALMAGAESGGRVLKSTRSRHVRTSNADFWDFVYVVRVAEDGFLTGNSGAIEYLD